MSLRKRTLLLVTLIIAGLVVALYLASQLIVLRGFEDEETRSAQRDVQRSQQFIATELDDMAGNVLDWSNWDSLYAFMLKNDQDFRDANLTKSAFVDNQISVMLLVKNDGSVLYSDSYDPSTGNEAPLSGQALASLTSGGLLQQPGSAGVITGVVSLTGSPVLVASAPILTSVGQGSSHGSLIFGRYLDNAETQRISRTILYPFSVYQVSDPQMPADVRDAMAGLPNAQSIQVARSDQIISGYALLDDVNGKPAVILRTDRPRTLYAHGQETVLLYFIVLMVAGLLFGLAIIFFLERGVLSRLARLSLSTNKVAARGDPSLRVTDDGHDELSSLAGDINRMLEALERSQRQMLASEGSYRQLMEQASDGILVGYPGEHFLDANSAMCMMLGYSPEEMRRLRLDDLVVPDDLSGISALREGVSAGTALLVEVEMIRKDGTTFPVEISASKLSDGRSQGIVRDITERKVYEHKLRENSASQALLLKQLMHAQEAERRRLSMDIHDGPLQMLGVALMALDRASRRNARGESDFARREMEYLRSTLLETVDEVRAVLADLSQDTLSTYGLVVAIQSQIGRFEEVTGIHVEFKNTLERRLLADIELLLYRLLQESLANVRKHSRADNVEVSLGELGTSILLRVRDNGIGFLVEDAFGRHEEGHGIGLRSMLERVEGINGSLVIKSSPGEGTTLEFSVPLPNRTLPLSTSILEPHATAPL
jgi:PAS domain S-box-containing protein